MRHLCLIPSRELTVPCATGAIQAISTCIVYFHDERKTENNVPAGSHTSFESMSVVFTSGKN
jgi:hypothetical protein